MEAMNAEPVATSYDPGWSIPLRRHAVIFFYGFGAMLAAISAILFLAAIVIDQIVHDIGRSLALAIIFCGIIFVLLSIGGIAAFILYRQESKVREAQQRYDDNTARQQELLVTAIGQVYGLLPMQKPAQATAPQIPQPEAILVESRESDQWTQINDHTSVAYSQQEIELCAMRACRILPSQGLEPSQANIIKHAGASGGGLANAVQLQMKEWGWANQDGANKPYRWSDRVMERNNQTALAVPSPLPHP